jgi:hypothetical protein
MTNQDPQQPLAGAAQEDYYDRRRRRISEANQLLRQIVDFVNAGDNASRDLWVILCALRGPDMQTPPDSGGYYNEAAKKEKRRSTSRLRANLGLLPTGFEVDPGTIEIPDALITGMHFQQHLEAAIEAMRAFGFGRI